MNKKPVFERKNSGTVLNLNSKGFRRKLLCDGITMNLGDTCAFSCEFCYVEAMVRKFASEALEEFNGAQGLQGEKELGFRDVVIRRKDPIGLLRKQLLKRGEPRFPDPEDRRVLFSSTLVDVAANMELLRETADACNFILQNTHWQIRLLSKSNLLYRLIADSLISDKYRDRLIFGFSTGTLDDKIAGAIETGTSHVSKRIEALHWLQDHTFKTFGMICPSLPQADYDKFSEEMCDAIRVNRCEHVWAEPINVRGPTLPRTLEALRRVGLDDEAARVEAVANDSGAWEEYARATFLAHSKHAGGKLRYLQYVKKSTKAWWKSHEADGAVLLGKASETAL